MWAVYLTLIGGLFLFFLIDMKLAAIWEYFSVRAYTMSIQAGGKQSGWAHDESTFVTHDGPMKKKRRIMRND